MLDLRIYRAAFLPTILAIVVLMFSLEPAPDALEGPISTPEFDGNQAARTARSIVDLAPDRTAGSAGDAAVADLVRERFGAIEGGRVSEQNFDEAIGGEDRTLTNVLLTLPGESPDVILIVAPRDAAEGSAGALSSAAATAALLGLAEDLGGSRHNRTIVLASTTGSVDGASGARQLVDGVAATATISQAVTISQPGVPEPEAPFAFSTSTEPESPNAQVVTTARAVAANRFEQPSPAPGAWPGLARLALPVGLGEQAVIAGSGVDSVAISGAGERTVESGEDDPDAISSDTLTAAGGSVLELALTLDDLDDAPAHGPGAYVRLGGNLVPGWSLALLAATLILPGLLAAGDTWLREMRARRRTVRRTLPWALERALIPLAALLLAYVLGLVNLIPDPRFPYDPGLYPPGLKAPVAFAGLALAAILAGLLIRPMRTPLDSEAHTLAAAAGIVTGLALVGIWLVNPYLALLLAPTGHVWLVSARAAGPPRAWIVSLVGLLALVPAFAAAASVAGQLDLGLEGAWQMLLVIVDGQLGFGLCLLWCAMLGGLIACVSATAARAPAESTPESPRVRGPRGYAGPGSLGGAPSQPVGR